MLSELLVLNIIVSVLHSIKHLPQCIHMINQKNGDGLSIQYIYGELLLNMVSTITTFKMFIAIHNSIYLLPVLLEKTFAFGMIIVMFYIKKKYENTEDDDWHSVESEYTEDDDWHSVESVELSR
jgi:uncharacterized protein with PQ loop repeat